MTDETEPQETPEETTLLLRTATSIAQQGEYTAMDKYRDMRKVFFGSDEGQRVFRELLSWGHMFKPSFQGGVIDPLRMAIHEGERNQALRLLATVTKQPRTDAPTQAVSTKPTKD